MKIKRNLNIILRNVDSVGIWHINEKHCCFALIVLKPLKGMFFLLWFGKYINKNYIKLHLMFYKFVCFWFYF